MPTDTPAQPPPSHEDLGHPPGEDLWVFAYGSLMWNPGFPFLERQDALVRGWRRAFCIYSHRHRGTPEVPGAVLGLDRGGACRGIAYRVAADAAGEALAYLWAREMVNRVYVPRRLPVRMAGGRTATALAFTADRTHPQYCGDATQGERARLIRQGVGISGRNVDYLASLMEHLRSLGIRDVGLEALAGEVLGG